MTIRVCVLCLFAVLTMTGQARAEFREVSGTATYRERLAMPPDALLEVKLVATTADKAEPRPLASIIVRPTGQVPVPFVLSYDSNAVEPETDYAIEAVLLVDGRPIFHDLSAATSLTNGTGGTVIITMKMVQPGETEPLITRDAILGDWEVFEIGGQPIEGGRVPTLSFDKDGNASGTGSCNRFNGRADIGEGTIALGPMAATQMACPDPLGAQERSFFDALSQVTGFEAHERVINLTDTGGEALLKLTPAN